MLEAGHIWNNNYKIIKPIGKGGMGNVYLAENLSKHALCAVKEQSAQGKGRELVFSEINIQKKLNHPALPHIYEFCETDGCLYIVMEYIEGRTLDSLLNEKGCFEEAHVIDWAKQLTDILIYLHHLAEPIVYRDLKPSNIMLDPQGKIHLIDFGIAQEYQRAEGEGGKLMALTRGYAAPEQYNERYRADVRTDIYSLGVTLHYLLTGKNPLKPPYHFERVRKLNPALSYAAESILKKCLQPNPDRRYKKAEDLKEDLEHIWDLERRLQAERRRRSGILACISAAVAILLSILFVKVRQGRNAEIEAYYALLDEAKEHMAQEEYADAAEKLDEAAAMQPEAEAAYIGVAKLYLEQGLYEECFAYVSSEIVARFQDIYVNTEFLDLMGTLYLRQDNSREAEYYFERLYENSPENTDYLYNLVYCRIKTGKKEEARKGIEKMRESDMEESLIEQLEEMLK